VEAQRSRETTIRKKNTSQVVEGSNRVTAISVAGQFDMDEVIKILRSHGFIIDPDGTEFDSDQVIHTRGVNNGDIFVFPSGTLVAWSLPEDVVLNLATEILLPAAIDAHIQQIETEDLEYTEDQKRESSTIKGDVIALGTKPGSQGGEISECVVCLPSLRCSLIRHQPTTRNDIREDCFLLWSCSIDQTRSARDDAGEIFRIHQEYPDSSLSRFATPVRSKVHVAEDGRVIGA